MYICKIQRRLLDVDLKDIFIYPSQILNKNVKSFDSFNSVSDEVHNV